MFPQTRYSVVNELRRNDPARRSRAFGSLVGAYWKPVYIYLRVCKQVGREDAEDLTQGFFASAFEKKTLDHYDASRARFRTWIRTCLDGFVANEMKAARRLKRAGAYPHVPLDFEDAEGELRHREIPAHTDPESFFHREWIRELVAAAVEELRREAMAADRALEFRIFERYDLEGPEAGDRLTYGEVADELGTTASKVTNALHAMRRRLRERVLARLSEVAAGEQDFRAEAFGLFGVDPW